MHLFKRTAKVLLTGFCLVYWMAQSTSASTLTYLYNFSGVSPDGAGPLAGVIFGQSGELYGTTNWSQSHGRWRDLRRVRSALWDHENRRRLRQRDGVPADATEEQAPRLDRERAP